MREAWQTSRPPRTHPCSTAKPARRRQDLSCYGPEKRGGRAARWGPKECSRRQHSLLSAKRKSQMLVTVAGSGRIQDRSADSLVRVFLGNDFDSRGQGCPRSCLLDTEQFHLKDEGAVGRDYWGSAGCAIGQVGRDLELVFVTHFHELE